MIANGARIACQQLRKQLGISKPLSPLPWSTWSSLLALQ
jgi:hypothetical protein